MGFFSKNKDQDTPVTVNCTSCNGVGTITVRRFIAETCSHAWETDPCLACNGVGTITI